MYDGYMMRFWCGCFLVMVLMGVTAHSVLALGLNDLCGDVPNPEPIPTITHYSTDCSGACPVGDTSCSAFCNPSTHRCANSNNDTCKDWCESGGCVNGFQGYFCCDNSYLDYQILACGTTGDGYVCRTTKVPNPGASCQKGLYGSFDNQVGDHIGEAYSCGPTTEAAAGTCGSGFHATWDGYFNVPVEGDYQFMINMYPAGSFQIDVNGDGVLDQCPGYTDPRWGWQFFTVRGDRYLSWVRGGNPFDQTTSLPRWAEVYLNRYWPDSSWPVYGGMVYRIHSGDSGVNYQEQSRNIQWWHPPYPNDYQGIDVLDPNTGREWYWGQISTGYVFDLIYPGLDAGDMPIDYPWIPPNETASGNRSSLECIVNQNHKYGDGAEIVPGDNNGHMNQTWFWVKRHLTAGAHKVLFNYYSQTHEEGTPTTKSRLNNFWYKGPGFPTFIQTINLNDDNCPFSTCNTPPTVPPTCSITGPPNVAQNVSANYCVTTTDAPNGAEIWKSSTGNQDWGTSPIRAKSDPGCSSTTFSQAGTYYVVGNAFGNGATCTGNPFPNGIPSGWSDCGPSCTMTVNVNAPPVLNVTPINYLVLKNSVGTIVPVDVGSSNQICQSIFTGTADQRVIKLTVTASDENGADDIVNVKVRLNANVWVSSDNTINGDWSIFSPTINSKNGNDRTYTFTMLLGPSLNSSTLYSLSAMATDTAGLTSGWVDSGRDLKIWDCQVPVSGNIYEVDQGTACHNYNTRSYVSIKLNYQSTVFQGLNGASTVTVNGGFPNFSSYTSSTPLENLDWGSTYAVSLNNTLNGSQPNGMGLTDLGAGVVSPTCQDNIQLSVGQAQADAYVANPRLQVDLASVRNQDPWWQVNGAGVMSSNQIGNRIPVTCVGPGCVPAIINENLNVGVSTDGVTMGQNISNGGGCDLDSNGTATGCRYSNPRNNFKIGDGRPDTVSFNSLYTKLYLGSGIGKTYPGGTNYSDITTDTSNNGGVAFVNGDLLIDGDNTITSGNFLMVVVKGSIGISWPANNVAGVLVSDGNINIGETSDTALNINGIVYSNHDIKIQRGYKNPLAEPNNNDDPAVKFNYRPDLLFNMPVEVSKVLSNWRVGQ